MSPARPESAPASAPLSASIRAPLSAPANAPVGAPRGGPADAILVVAALSARTLAESARQGGWQVIALDLFGDLDTRRAARHWAPIGAPGALAIDPHRLVSELAAAAREPGVIGWVAGAGFDGAPHLLDAGGRALPLLGMPAEAVRAVRDPRRFFDALGRLGLRHPAVSFRPPDAPGGWLVKRAGGSGGWHICSVTAGAATATATATAHVATATADRRATADLYYQRRQPGEPMSALFLADGRAARLVGLNRLLVDALDGLPYVYCGAIGPVRDDVLQARVQDALDALVPAFGLRGLASLDFVADDGAPWLLEINPRPSASMALHADAWPDGLLRAHVHAVQGRLPAQAPSRSSQGVRGTRTLFAREPCRIDADLSATLATRADCHDLPAAGTRFARNEPVCSVTVEAADAAAAERRLAERLAWIAARLKRDLPLPIPTPLPT